MPTYRCDVLVITPLVEELNAEGVPCRSVDVKPFTVYRPDWANLPAQIDAALKTAEGQAS